MSLQDQVTRLVEASNQLTEAVHKAVDDLPELCAAVAGSPVLARAFVQERSAMWPGHTAADGQELEREHYPAAWAAIRDRKVPVCDDAEFLANPEMRGFFTEGNGVTTFRVPDYNGVMPDSLAAAFFRGDGKNSAGECGKVQADIIRNITGSISNNINGVDGRWLGVDAGIGAFKPRNTSGPVRDISTAGSDSSGRGGVDFDASRVVPTGPENRPVAVTGCWAVKLFGVVQNVGEVDAMSLMTRVAGLEHKDRATTATAYLQGDPIKGTAFFVRRNGIVTFRAYSSIVSDWPNHEKLFDIPIGFRPHDDFVSAEFPTNISQSTGDNGRLIISKSQINSFQMIGSQWLFRTSGSWVCEE